MPQQRDNPDPVHMDDSAERSAAHTNDESPPAPISTPTAPMPIPQSRSPFFSLPLELRRMVYRYLLVTKGDIHLDSLLGNSTPCQHNTPKICAALLRVCRLITPEALDVLYGGNFFTVKADNYPNDCDPPYEFPPPVIEKYFTKANRSQLRKLTIIHQCCWKYCPVIDGPELDSLLSEFRSFVSEFGLDNLDYDFPHENEPDLPVEFSPYDMSAALKPEIWNPILSKLTSLAIVLTVPCCDPVVQRDIISGDQLENEERAKDLMRALAYYRLQAGIPASVRVFRRVRCTSHRCTCGTAQVSINSEACAKARRYVERVWRRTLALEAAEDRALAAAAGTASADQ